MSDLNDPAPDPDGNRLRPIGSRSSRFDSAESVSRVHLFAGKLAKLAETRDDEFPRLQMDDSAAHADCYRLSTIIGAQLAQDVLEMNLDGFLCDEQSFCDIPIPVAGSHVT